MLFSVVPVDFHIPMFGTRLSGQRLSRSVIKCLVYFISHYLDCQTYDRGCLVYLFSYVESHLQYLRQQRLKRFSSDKSDSSPLLPGIPRETQRTFSTTSGDGEQECPPNLSLTKEEDLFTTTGGNTKPPAFEVGDMVKVEHKSSPWYGVVRWIGQLPGSSKCIAGIEMVGKVILLCTG